MVAVSTQALDEGWVLEEPAAAVPVTSTRMLTLVAAPPAESTERAPAAARAPATGIDDAWCVDDGWVLEEPPAVAPIVPAAPALALVVAPAEHGPSVEARGAHDGWLVASDERAPGMELSAEEEAFFAMGEALAETAACRDGFADLATGPAPTFWQRLWRRQR